MAELNFGLLTPPGSQSIGNAFVTGMDQAQEARARDLQMQQSMRQGEVTQMQLQKLKQDAAGLAEFSRKVSAMGGPSDPVEIAKAYLAHPDIEMQKFGAGLMQRAQAIAGYKALPPDIATAPPTPTVGAAPVGQTNALALPPTTTAAPVGQPNALALAAVGAAPVAPTATVESRLAEIRGKLARLEPFTGPNGAPAAISEADMLKQQAAELIKSHTVAPGGTLVRAGLPDFNAPAPRSEFETLLANSGLSEPEKTAARQARVGKDSTTPYEYLTVLDRLGKTTEPDARKQLLARLTYLSTHRPPSTQTVNLPGQERAFEQELGKGQAKGLLESRSRADDAVEIITTVAEGRKILDSGAITGFGADFIVQFNQALKQAGYNYGGDASANSQAYGANMAQNVGKIIKLFGAGTGLSNADREYAEKMAGGQITMDGDSIRRVLDINEKQARWVIATHNKRAAGIKSNIPLTVEAPTAGNVTTNPQYPGFSIGKR